MHTGDNFNTPCPANPNGSMFTVAEITGALNNKEFFLEYLPTISLENGRCIGAEALVRWRRDSRDVEPMEFVPIIENTPYSGVLTYWVIDTIGEELLPWLHAQDGIHISINIPPEVFGRGGVAYAIQKSGLDGVASKLMLEVTERGLLDPLGIAGLREAIDRGVSVALDDLNIMDANFFILSRIPVNIVKLDKSFADAMLLPDWSLQKIAVISALIRNGNLRVIAEGVETAKQVEILLEAGIQMAQGWYFSPSLPAQDFIAYFAERQ
ncbi:EAL domain-containing protein [Herbaspirillum sp. HC18]|nr:EAL domain-containing protein [Herbaspirillum sp. HC18]